MTDWTAVREWTGQDMSHMTGRIDNLQLRVLNKDCLWLCKTWKPKKAMLMDGKLHIIDENNIDPTNIELAGAEIKFQSKGNMINIVAESGKENNFKLNSEDKNSAMKLFEDHKWYGQMMKSKTNEPVKDQPQSLTTPGAVVNPGPSAQTSQESKKSATQCTSPDKGNKEDGNDESLDSSGKKSPTHTDKEDEHEETETETVKSTGPGTSVAVPLSKMVRNQPVLSADTPTVTYSYTSSNQRMLSQSGTMRHHLPKKQIPILPISIKMIWDLVQGRSMHISYFEPLCLLQCLSEQYEYSNVLEEAMREHNPVHRMARIAGFAVSGYVSSQYRCRKPFNPRLAETFELDLWDDRGWRFLAEQVHRKPDITAVHVESKSGWSIAHTVELEYHGLYKIGWTGLLDVEPLNTIRLSVSKLKETYEWNKVHTILHHTLHAPKRCLSNSGVMHIKCDNGYTARLTFDKGETVKTVHGHVYAPNGKEMMKLEGVWNSHLNAVDKAHVFRCFTATKFPSHFNDYFGFTYFGMQLNVIQEKDKGRLPLSDSRFRPDLQLLDDGKIEQADAAKLRLEKDARTLRAKGQESQPQWFHCVSNTPKHWDWKFKHEYWKAKADNFRNCNIPRLW